MSSTIASRSRETGLHPVQWLRALTEETGAALRAEIARGADDWQKLWALLCGLALTAPRMPADAASETARSFREEFPDIKDPYETALAEVDKVAELLAGRGLEAAVGCPADDSRSAGQPLAARDAYGSRLLLTAPFGYDGSAPDHWYAWDIDLCWIAVVVGAGVFASAEDALREWRDAVGPAASGAALSPCAAGMTARLLAPCLQTGRPGGHAAGAGASRAHPRVLPAPAPCPRPHRIRGPRRRLIPVRCRPGAMKRSWTGTPHGTMTSPGSDRGHGHHPRRVGTA